VIAVFLIVVMMIGIISRRILSFFVVIPGIVVGLSIGLDTEGYGSKQWSVLSKLMSLIADSYFSYHSN